MVLEDSLVDRHAHSMIVRGGCRCIFQVRSKSGSDAVCNMFCETAKDQDMVNWLSGDTESKFEMKSGGLRAEFQHVTRTRIRWPDVGCSESALAAAITLAGLAL